MFAHSTSLTRGRLVEGPLSFKKKSNIDLETFETLDENGSVGLYLDTGKGGENY